MNRRKANKRHILLLEVLIALALVALCVFPLVAPHVFILKAQYEFNRKIELDQTAGKVYGRILEKAYRHEIPWEAIEKGQTFPIDAELWKAAGVPPQAGYKGIYRLSIGREKGGNDKPMSANVINTMIALEPARTAAKAAPTVYEYKFFAARIKEAQEPEAHEDKTPPRHTP